MCLVFTFYSVSYPGSTGAGIGRLGRVRPQRLYIEAFLPGEQELHVNKVSVMGFGVEKIQNSY